jgi:hypothetical protein
MNGRLVCAIGLSLACLTPSAAWAQDKGDTGLAITSPTAIGLIWHTSDRLAIRTDVSFGFSETDGEGSSPDISSRSVTLGVAALLYTHRWDELRTYFSPRFTYSHATTDLASTSTNVSDSTVSSWGISGSIGAQYSLGQRFGVFAEAGLLYSSQRSEISIVGVADRTTWTFGTRTAVGGILYF